MRFHQALHALPRAKWARRLAHLVNNNEARAWASTRSAHRTKESFAVDRDSRTKTRRNCWEACVCTACPESRRRWYRSARRRAKAAFRSQLRNASARLYDMSCRATRARARFRAESSVRAF